MKYVCIACQWEYDPAVGDPDGGIAPGTAFDDIPDDLFTVQSDAKEYGTLLWPHCALAFLALLLVNVAARKFINLG